MSYQKRLGGRAFGVCFSLKTINLTVAKTSLSLSAQKEKERRKEERGKRRKKEGKMKEEEEEEGEGEGDHPSRRLAHRGTFEISNPFDLLLLLL